MKRLTLLISFLILTLVTGSAFAQFTQSQMVVEWQRAKTYTKAYLDARRCYSFKPTPEIRSLLNKCFICRLTIMVCGFRKEKQVPVEDTSLEKLSLRQRKQLRKW